MIGSIKAFEHQYGTVKEVRRAVRAIIALLPDLDQIFRPAPVHKAARGDIGDIVLDKMRPHLDQLQARGMLTYATGSNKVVFGPSGGGNLIEVRIHVAEPYYDIANDVMQL